MRPVLLVTLLVTLFGHLAPKTALANVDFSQVYAKAIHAAEVANRLPRWLLHGVSLTETGRWNKRAQASVVWPWTITAEGKGKNSVPRRRRSPR